jgi:hypothetical protein
VAGHVTEILDKQRGNMTQTPIKRKAFYHRNEALSLSELRESKKVIYSMWCDQIGSGADTR